MNKSQNNLNLYLHVPFCRSKCPYCHFYSIGEDQKKYNYDNYIKEMHKEIVDKYRHFNLKEYKLNSIYFGGGTPSLLPAGHIQYLLDLIQSLWEYDEKLEITLESNPNYILPNYLEQITQIGINRLSLGIQTVNPKLQEFSGRHSNKKHLEEIIQKAKTLNLKINLDFIYAWPKETTEDLSVDLNFAQEQNPDHIAFYELEIKDDTQIQKLKKASPEIFPQENEIIKMRQYLEENFAKNNWEHYEISNWAKNNSYSQHNLNFWLNEEYLGIGPSAASYIQEKLINNKAEIHQYYNFQEQYEIIPLTNEENTLQYLIRALRINKGLDLNKIEKNLAEKLLKYSKKLNPDFFLENSSKKIILSEKGWLQYDNLLNEFSEIVYAYFSKNKSK